MKFRELNVETRQEWPFYRRVFVDAIFGLGEATYTQVPAPRFQEAGVQDASRVIGLAIVAALFAESL